MPAQLPVRVVADIEDALRKPGPLPFDYLKQIASINSTSVRTVYKIKKRLELGIGALPLSGRPVPVIQAEHERALKLVQDKRPWIYLD